ncbi:S9 family peptidase [candidate division KSB1 bacterium]|nr:S9 family peptidase [candidate division KSB1 bacterium]
MSVKAFGMAILVCTLIYAFCGKSRNSLRPPVAEIKNVVDTFHGVEVNDPYRWLEDWNDEAVQNWSEAQDAYARNFLKNLPGVAEIYERVSEIETGAGVSYYALSHKGGRLFAVKNQPPLNQPLLVVMNSADAPQTERILVDPNRLDPDGGTTIDWFVPSPDGRLVAVSLSVGGSEMGDVHLFDVDSGAQMDIVIGRVNGGTAGGDLAWLPDGRGFFYTRYPRPGEKEGDDLNFYQQVWFHRIGTPENADRYILGKKFPRIAEIRLNMHEKSGMLLVTVQYGDSGRFAHYLMDAGGRVRQITDYDDLVVSVTFGARGNLYLISRKDAPRGSVLHLPLARPILTEARVIIPQGEDAVVSSFGGTTMIATSDRLLITYQLGGPSEIRVFSFAGEILGKPEVAPVSSVGGLALLDEAKVLFSASSYIQAPAWYEFDVATKTTRKTALFYQAPVDYSDTEVVREFAVSKDGTRIPVNIIMRRDTKLDGSNPAILYGYGGFGISQTPRFSSLRRVYIEQGFVYAIANIRGGSEFGEAWHRDGILTKKQNGFDDFAAAMRHLIDRGYTRAEKLAIMGGSNGGLLMGAMITQHSDLFRVTVSTVGIYDMMRSELTPNGSFNIPEYGTVKEEDQFQALYAYSPYHNVKDGVAYPAVLFMTGANDPRVDPMHSRKMTARLQAATVGKNPILLRTSSSTGHGIGTPLNERIKEDVDEIAFVFYQLGVKYKKIE